MGYTCDAHLTSPRPEKKPVRTLSQMRLGFEVGDRVEVTDEYTKCFRPSPAKGIGVIVSFKDPYEWEKGHSVASADFPCGYKDNLNVAWLKKEGTYMKLLKAIWFGIAAIFYDFSGKCGVNDK